MVDRAMVIAKLTPIVNNNDYKYIKLYNTDEVVAKSVQHNTP